MLENDIKKALDILDKLDFFGGQRAGRELWNEKPVDVQNIDIENFSKDIAFLKELINRLKAESEQLRNCNDGNLESITKLVDASKNAKAEAIKEFAERLKEKSWNTGTVHGIVKVITIEELNNLLKEMAGNNER